MKHTLLLSAALALCLTWPAAALADPPSNQGAGAGDQGAQAPDKAKDQAPTGQKGSKGQAGAHGDHAGQGAAAVAGAARDTAATAPTPAAPKLQRGQVFRQPGVNGASGQAGQGAAAASGSARDGAAVYAPPTPQGSQAQRGQASGRQHGNGSAAQGASAGAAAQNFQAQPGQPRSGQRQAQVRQAMQPPAHHPALAHWNRSVSGPARSQASQQWRQANSGWDSHALWRRDTDWWRSNSAFRLFGGARVGFFFIPEVGYVSVPAQYRAHYWRSGDQLPNWFWRYEVRDYWNYGLPQPPDGCMWVWVDNNVALIDASDGYILDIVHNAW